MGQSPAASGHPSHHSATQLLWCSREPGQEPVDLGVGGSVMTSSPLPSLAAVMFSGSGLLGFHPEAAGGCTEGENVRTVFGDFSFGSIARKSVSPVRAAFVCFLCNGGVVFLCISISLPCLHCRVVSVV